MQHSVWFELQILLYIHKTWKYLMHFRFLGLREGKIKYSKNMMATQIYFLGSLTFWILNFGYFVIALFDIGIFISLSEVTRLLDNNVTIMYKEEKHCL